MPRGLGTKNELETQRQKCTPPAVGKEPAKANAHKAAREHMEKEAAQKLIGTDRHQLPLAAVRQRARVPDSAQLLDLLGQVASALSAAHVAGIVHRDIEPENIMLRARRIC